MPGVVELKGAPHCRACNIKGDVGPGCRGPLLSVARKYVKISTVRSRPTKLKKKSLSYLETKSGKITALNKLLSETNVVLGSNREKIIVLKS